MIKIDLFKNLEAWIGEKSWQRVKNVLVNCPWKGTQQRGFLGGPVAKASRFQSGDLSLIPGQGTRFYMPQIKSLHAAMKTKDPACCS